MVALSRGLAPLAVLLASVDGARIAKKRAPNLEPNTKFIAGVPIINYHAAYGGRASLSTLEETLEEEWIVMMKEGTTDAQIDSLCKTSKNGCKMVGHPDKGGVAFLDMRGTEKDLEAVLESAQGSVQIVEPDQTMHLIPELEVEPASSESWGLSRVGANGRNGNMGAGVHIYILDTGVRTTHQDFGDRASPKVDFSFGKKPCNGDLNCAADGQGHGTHCAGTAAGASFGVASQAKVYGVKVLGDNGAGNLFSIIGSIDYLATEENRPAVGSMSLGGTCPLGVCGIYFAMKMAVDKAVNSGVTVVVAGGNSNKDSCGFMPAFVPSAITVGSTDSEDVRSSFSNYGKCTDIWAPGSKITSATHEDDTGSKTFSGTSMACPHVAGGAALILEQFPEFKSPQVLEKLLARAATNYITDLQPGDVNKLLYIAADAPPKPGNVSPASSLAEKAQDCYSKYDGKPLLKLTPCSSAEVGELESELESLGCTLVNDEIELGAKGCADAEAVCSSEAAAQLEKRGSASVVTPDAGGFWRESSGVAQPFTEGFGIASDFYSAWRDLDARMAHVESLVQASGGIAKMETAGQSLQGRDIKIVRFTGKGYSPGGKKIFVTFNLHAREWIGGMSGVYATEQLIAKVEQDPSYLDGMEVVFMPMTNPDGFVQSSDKDRMHRKNMRSGKCFGVDVNRNFDAHWRGGGSSDSPCQDTYHGPETMSEPETLVIAKVMQESPMTLYIDVHAYSQLILSAYGWTTQNSPRAAEYRAIGSSIQKAIKSSNGNTFKEGPIAQVLYQASGSSVDYADDLGALGICFELSPGRFGGGGFAPPASAILPGAKECYAGLLASFDYVKNPPPPPAPTPPPAGNCPWHGCLFGCGGTNCEFCDNCQ